MVIVKKSEINQLIEFSKMSKQQHVSGHLNAKSLEMHQKEFDNSDIVYLSIYCNSNHLAGYIIFVKEKLENSIQFKGY